MNPLRIYTDTSVIGGCFDQEFKTESLRFLKLVKSGYVTMLLSDIVIEELSLAPSQVRETITLIPDHAVEKVLLSQAALNLRDAYLAAKILDKKSENDATHVALATCARADAIVSWNFKHIVRLDKMKAFNQVNLLNGYGILTIVTPREVAHEKDKK